MTSEYSFTAESNSVEDFEDLFSEPEDHDEYCEAYSMANAISDRHDLKPGQRFTAKVAPCWSGIGRWFSFEQDVRDWIDQTQIEVKHRGPALKQNLVGPIEWYKEYLDRDKITDDTVTTADDHGKEKHQWRSLNVAYFMETMHALAMRGQYPLFLRRLKKYQNLRRPRGMGLEEFFTKYDRMMKKIGHLDGHETVR